MSLVGCALFLLCVGGLDPARIAPQVRVTDEVTGKVLADGDVSVAIERRPFRGGVALDVTLTASGAPRGCEIACEFPILSAGLHVFTPSEQGEMSLDDYPTYTAAPYGTYGWGPDVCYVLPLVSLLDHRSDRGLTIALPPDPPAAPLQIEWADGRVLRLRLAHRALGDGHPARVRLLLLPHEADAHAAIRVYSDAFPRWFRPGLPRTGPEGAFWYHHIQAHPDFAEMRRQGVRWMWSSFWFPYLGEYLPEEREWIPYTFARWWSLGERTGDERIRSFCREMAQHGIDVTAYFNLTEYGGHGGERGDSIEADSRLAGEFAEARILDGGGRPIPTWEGAYAMNPDPALPFHAHLMEQAARHLERLPELTGLTVDRLDWASRLDYARGDGRLMDGDRPVTDLAEPIGRALGDLTRLAHAAGKRVFVNQYWRVEMLKDVDGTCHEYDMARGIGYLSPYRPAAAWHARTAYSGDLTGFEAQLKLRLRMAVFPQMIAHEFPISQQAPDPEAADLLELYAPLFEQLRRADRVLSPHAVEVTGANRAEAYRRPDGTYAVPVASQVRAVACGSFASERVALTLRVPDAAGLAWTFVQPLEGDPYSARPVHGKGFVVVELAQHATASVVVVGAGTAPLLAHADEALFAARSRAIPRDASLRPPGAERRRFGRHDSVALLLDATETGASCRNRVGLAGVELGSLGAGPTSFPLPPEAVARLSDETSVTIRYAGEAGEHVVRSAALVRARGEWLEKVAEWTPRDPADAAEPWGLTLPLRWIVPERIGRQAAARALGIERGPSSLGADPVLTPDRGPDAEVGGCRVRVSGKPYVWAASTVDARVPPGADGRRAARCWFDERAVEVRVEPGDAGTRRVTLYLLDFDRDSRSARVVARDVLGRELASLDVPPEATAEGAAVSFGVTGTVSIEIRRTGGTNITLSAVAVGAAEE